MFNNARPGSLMDILNKNLFEKSLGRAIFDTTIAVIFGVILFRLIAFIILGALFISFLSMVMVTNNSNKREYCAQQNEEVFQHNAYVANYCKNFMPK